MSLLLFGWEAPWVAFPVSLSFHLPHMRFDKQSGEWAGHAMLRSDARTGIALGDPATI